MVAGYLRPILSDFEKAPAIPNHDDLKVIVDMTNLLEPFQEATFTKKRCKTIIFYFFKNKTIKKNLRSRFQ
jgi:hypothetical protein